MKTYFNEFNCLSPKMLDNAFLKACSQGDLDKVKYLLTSPELEQHANIYAHEGDALILASRINHYKLMEYLLHSPELKKHISIHTQKDYALIDACENGNLDMVKYLVSSPNLKEHIAVNTKANGPYKGDRAFLISLICDQLNILQYFIFDLGIEKSKDIETYLANNAGNISSAVEQMFKARDLARTLALTLKNQLPLTETNNKTPKVKL